MGSTGLEVKSSSKPSWPRSQSKDAGRVWHKLKVVRLAFDLQIFPDSGYGRCTVESSLVFSDTQGVSPYCIIGQVALLQVFETRDARSGYCSAVDMFVDSHVR